jgi:hypothetical protein
LLLLQMLLLLQPAAGPAAASTIVVLLFPYYLCQTVTRTKSFSGHKSVSLGVQAYTCRLDAAKTRCHTNVAANNACNLYDSVTISLFEDMPCQLTAPAPAIVPAFVDIPGTRGANLLHP